MYDSRFTIHASQLGGLVLGRKRGVGDGGADVCDVLHHDRR